MSTLSIALRVPSTAVSSSESLPVEVSLRNGGTAPAEAPDPDAPSVFEFALRPLDPGLQALTLSASRARLARDPNPVPVRSESVSLKAGAEHVYRSDLANFMSDPLPAGRYAVSVVFQAADGALQSPEVSISVSPPVVQALAATGAPASGGLASAYVHRPAQGAAAILQRESRPQRPQDGVAYRRHTLASGEKADGIAVTVQATDGKEKASGRWYAYLQGSRLGAGAAEGATNFLHINPAELDLQQPRLHPIGWQPHSNEALFVAIGTDARGKPAVALAKFLARERKMSVRTAPLGVPALPAAWAARFRREGGGSVDLVLAESTQGSTRIVFQSFAVQSGQATTPKVVLQRSEPLATLALAPLARGGIDAFDALFGPAGSPSHMTFIRQPMAGGAPATEFPFNLPADEKQQPPTNWALAPTPLEAPVTVARFRGQVIGRILSPTGRGFVVDPQAARVSLLQVHAIGEKYWAVWFEEGRGIQYRMLP